MFAEQPGTTDVSDVETTPAYGDSSGAAETPTADGAETQAPPDPSQAQAGPPRDEHGRFRARADEHDGHTSATGETPDGDDAQPATDDPDAPADTPDPEPDAAANAPAGQAAPPKAPPGTPGTEQPFTFPHRGQQYALTGATVKPNGSIVIPAAQRTSVELMLSRAREHEFTFPQVRAQWQRQQAALQRELETKHAGVDAFGALFQDSPDLETFLTRAAEFYQTLPALRQQMTQQALAERDRRIAELEGRAPPSQPGSPNGQGGPQGPTPEDYAEAIRGQTGQMLRQARTAIPEFQGFTEPEMDALLPQMVRRAGLYVREATPDDAAVYGVQVGEPVFDADAFAHEVKLVAGETIRQKRAAAAKAKVQPRVDAAAQRNAAVLAPNRAPPVPKPAAEVGAGGGDEEGFDSFEDFVAWGSGVRKPKRAKSA